jgi:hypothetical protein
MLSLARVIEKGSPVGKKPLFERDENRRIGN